MRVRNTRNKIPRSPHDCCLQAAPSLSQVGSKTRKKYELRSRPENMLSTPRLSFFSSLKIPVLHEWNVNEMYLGFIWLSLEVESSYLQGYKANSSRYVNFAADGHSRISTHRSMSQQEIRARSGWELHNASWWAVVQKYMEREQLNDLKLKEKIKPQRRLSSLHWNALLFSCTEMHFYFETRYFFFFLEEEVLPIGQNQKSQPCFSCSALAHCAALKHLVAMTGRTRSGEYEKANCISALCFL